MLNDEQGYVAYKGRTNTLVNYDPVKRVWMMRIVNDPDTFAVSRANLESLLMGREPLVCHHLASSVLQDLRSGPSTMTGTALERRAEQCCLSLTVMTISSPATVGSVWISVTGQERGEVRGAGRREEGGAVTTSTLQVQQ